MSERLDALIECLRIAKAAQYSKTPATDTMHGIQKLITAQALSDLAAADAELLDMPGNGKEGV